MTSQDILQMLLAGGYPTLPNQQPQQAQQQGLTPDQIVQMAMQGQSTTPQQTQMMETQLGLPATQPGVNSKADPAAIAYGNKLNAQQNNTQGYSSAQQVSQAQQNSGNQFSQYKVQQGDTLWGIAQKYLGNGNRWHELEGFHGDPKALQPGTIIHIPVQGQQQAQPKKNMTSVGPSPSNISSSAMLG